MRFMTLPFSPRPRRPSWSGRPRRPPWSSSFDGRGNGAQLFEHAKDAAVVSLHVPAEAADPTLERGLKQSRDEYLADTVGLHRVNDCTGSLGYLGSVLGA